MTKTATFIPVAGGKGGVGKSLFTANLALALAELHHDTVVVDLDLGGSNLHSFLGLSNQFPGIGDFLKARTAELENFLVPTKMPTLKFLPGDGRTPFMANIPTAQKLRLLSHLNRIPADYILLDLGSGSSFNTLDFFGISKTGFVVTTFEHPSLMNVLSFLKNFLYRTIERIVGRENHQVRITLQEIYKQPMTGPPVTAQYIQDQIAALNPELGEQVKKICSYYRPRFIFNRGEHPDTLRILQPLDKSLREIVSLQADYFGFIFEDPAVRESVRRGVPLVTAYRDSVASQSVLRVADRVARIWGRPIENSAELLTTDTIRFHKSVADRQQGSITSFRR